MIGGRTRPHTHRCAIPDCRARVACYADPVSEGEGDRDAQYPVRRCPAEGPHLCEDHASWVRCDRCGDFAEILRGGLCPGCICRHCGGDAADDAHMACGLCPDEDRFVRCDQACRALVTPISPGEIAAAYQHWRFHRSMGGCSHGH